MGKGLDVKIWGTRGSMTASYPDRMVYGGNTSCISVEWDDGIVIFDCGSGLRAFGIELLKREYASDKKVLHIFISHMHLDHIIGLPFLPLIYQKDWTIHFYGTAKENTRFRDAMNYVMGPPYWPVALEDAGAAICWHELRSGDIVALPDSTFVRVLRANHPDSSIIFRLEKDDIHIVYGLDYELTDLYKNEFEEFVRNCSLLFFDGMYTEAEIDRYSGFGHSCWEQGIRILETCNVKQLCITHHDWGRTDSELAMIEHAAKSKHENCVFAREGMQFRFEGNRILILL